MRRVFTTALMVLIILLLPLIVVAGCLAMLVFVFYRISLYLLVWSCWCTRGRNVLLVYSESPLWYDDIRATVIPKLPGSSNVLNWSQRRTWKWYQLSVHVARHFGGNREFNPIVVIFRPFRPAKIFRFWSAFKDQKHGKTETLVSLKREMFESISRPG